MARNYDATPLAPTEVGCPPTCPSGPGRPGAIAPIVSVSSVNGESGDVVLKDLTIGTKVYNGSNEIEIFASDLGLGKAVVFIKTVPTTEKVIELLADAKAGDLYFCNQDGYFYLSVGEGDYKCYVSDMKIKDYSLIVNTTSKIAVEIDNDTFELVEKLYDLNGNIIFESEPVLLPSGMKDAIKRGYYDTETQEIVFVLKNDTEIRVPIAGLIDNIQPKITESNKLAFRLVEGLAEMKVELEQAISAEVADRTTAVANEAVLRSQADTTEREERIAADQVLQANIDAEAATRLAKDNELAQALETETAQRIDSFDLVKEKIKEEAEARVKVAKDLEIETQTRVEADDNLLTLLNNEINLRESGDITLTNNLATEKTTRETNESALAAAISSETTARTDKDTELQRKIEDEALTRDTNDKVLEQMLLTETANRQAADDAEIQARVTAVNNLEKRIETEAQIRETMDNGLLAELRAEETARADADTVLQQNIDNEAAIRNQGDADLLTALRNEINARESADAVLQDEIDHTPLYSIAKDAEPGEYGAVYHLTKQIPGQDPINIGDPINIAKDLFVKDAEVRKVESEYDPAYIEGGIPLGHTCIDLTIKAESAPTQEKHVYIDVTTLIDIYTAGSGITIDDNRIIRLSDATQDTLSRLETGLSNEINTRISVDNQLSAAVAETKGLLNSHTANVNNPHHVTASQLGLGNVDNTADLDKPISNLTREAINAEAEARTIAVTNETNDRITAISNEATARSEADASESSERIKADNAESQARMLADTALQTSIRNNASNITNEITARVTGDNNLQSQIDELRNSALSSHAVGIIEGDGVTTEFIVNHNLDTYNIIIQVYDMGDNRSTVLVDDYRMTVNSTKFVFKEAPAADKKYRVLFYAINDIIITFNNNGGTGSMSALSSVKGYSVLVPKCTMTPPTDKEFDKWAINDPNGEKIAANTRYIFSADTVLYATWKDKATEPNIYYGSSLTARPQTVDGLNGERKTIEDLVANGYTKTIEYTETEYGFATFAVAVSLGVVINSISQYTEGTGWADVTGDFTIETVNENIIASYNNLVTGPCQTPYKLTFKTA